MPFCFGVRSVYTGPVVSVVASFPQQTENRTFCLVLQSWLTASHCTDYYYVTSLFRLLLRVPVVLGLNATRKLIRPSSSSSSSSYWQTDRPKDKRHNAACIPAAINSVQRQIVLTLGLYVSESHSADAFVPYLYTSGMPPMWIQVYTTWHKFWI